MRRRENRSYLFGLTKDISPLIVNVINLCSGLLGVSAAAGL